MTLQQSDDITEIDPPLDDNRRDPKDVLYDTMNFYDKKARKIANKILKSLKDSEKADSQTMALMFKAMVDADKMCVDAAAKLAPYVHPRLQNITSQSEVKHIFVIQAPKMVDDPTSWSRIVELQKSELDKKKIESIKSLEINTKNSIPDAEIIKN